MDRDASRRWFLAGIGLLVAATLAAYYGFVRGERDGGWPSYGYDAGNSGYNPNASGPASAGGAGREFERAWSRDADEGTSAPFVVGDGTAFWPTGDGTLRALDAASGDVEWTAERGGWPIATSDAVYVCTSEGVSALDAADGTRRWALDATPMSPIALSEGGLYVFDRHENPGEEDDDDVVAASSLYEIDAETGDREVIREYTSNAGSAGRGAVSPRRIALVDGALLFYASSALHAVDLDDGADRWTFEDENYDWMHNVTPVGADGRAYTPTSGPPPKLAAVDAASGEVEWEFIGDSPDANLVEPAVDDDAVYVTQRETLTAVDADTGDELWSTELPERGFGGTLRAKPAVADGVAYANNDRYLWAVDAANGDVLVEYETDGEFVSAPVVAGRRAYATVRVSGATSALRAFEPA